MGTVAREAPPIMSIVLEHLVKVFHGQPAVNDVSLQVADGEFFVLLGPSGSGKSTVLRMIAGLLDVDVGRVLLHGADVTHMAPQNREVGFVFQHYALFRHMTVAANIEFGLRIRRVPTKERRSRRDELLELVGLVGLERRFPHQLSGGQQQRVALARALAHSPKVLLMDEPFGALDAGIRAELRRSLRAIQRELSITTIFVTHDQAEAFELADRLGVMHYGRLLELGRPEELYLRPQTEFVATFLGRANLMIGEVGQRGLRIGQTTFPLRGSDAVASGQRRVQVLFRPEDVAVKDSRDALRWPLLGRAVVESVDFYGGSERLRLRLPELSGVRALAPTPPFGSEAVLVEAIRSAHNARDYPLRAGDQAWVGIRRLHALMHPGLRLLLVTDGSPDAAPAVQMGGQIAQLAHARLTVLACDLDHDGAQRWLKDARDRIGSGVAALDLREGRGEVPRAVARERAREAYDLLIAWRPARDVADVVCSLLEAGDHHLLLVPAGATVPRKVLVCAAVGEPSKADVLFTGRLIRHLGAEATILTVLDPGTEPRVRTQCERFLAAGVRQMALVGVKAQPAIREGASLEQIRAQVQEAGHDLVVMGQPSPDRSGRLSCHGIVGDLVHELTHVPLLIVRPTVSGP